MLELIVLDSAFRFTSSTAPSKSSAAQQVSLIDFDDEAPPPSTAPQSQAASLLDDLSSLSIGTSSPYSPPAPIPQQNQNMFNFNSLASPSSTSSVSSPVPQRANITSNSSTSGSYFSNPAYGGGIPPSTSSSHYGNGSGSGSGTASPAINWGGAASNSKNSNLNRSSTPVTPGAIQLGSPGGAGGSMNSLLAGTTSNNSNGNGKAKDPFADLSAWE